MTNKELFYACNIRLGKLAEVDRIIDRMLAAKGRYEPVVKATVVPWWWIAIIHNMEFSGRFTGHLHNGDPLTARTIHVPAGRPAVGEPPFTWEQSAIDALIFKKLDRIDSWGLDNALERMERYNGLGYRKRGLISPYLWAGSQHYTKGKFVQDGRYDPEAVSKQIGGGVLLKHMKEQNIIELR